MEQDLRNAQSDEAASASLEPKLWHVLSVPKKMEDIILDAIESFKAFHDYQPFDLITEGDMINVYYRDYQHPATDEKMMHYAYSLGIEFTNSAARHLKNKINNIPQQTFTTPVEGC